MSHIHNACLTTARDLIFGNPEYSNSFEKTQQYCKGLLARNSIHATHTGKDSHRVLKTQHKQGNNKKSAKTGGKRVHAGHYYPQEYHVLTLEEKAQVKALCEQAKKHKTLAITIDGNNNGGNTWEVSSVSKVMSPLLPTTRLRMPVNSLVALPILISNSDQVLPVPL